MPLPYTIEACRWQSRGKLNEALLRLQLSRVEAKRSQRGSLSRALSSIGSAAVISFVWSIVNIDLYIDFTLSKNSRVVSLSGVFRCCCWFTIVGDLFDYLFQV